MIRDRLRSRQFSALGWLGLGTVAGILIYNTWMVSCGHCSLQMLLTIPWLGWLLITLNLCAALFLYILRRRSSRQATKGGCDRCGISLRDGWRFCPSCGRQSRLQIDFSSPNRAAQTRQS